MRFYQIKIHLIHKVIQSFRGYLGPLYPKMSHISLFSFKYFIAIEFFHKFTKSRLNWCEWCVHLNDGSAMKIVQIAVPLLYYTFLWHYYIQLKIILECSNLSAPPCMYADFQEKTSRKFLKKLQNFSLYSNVTNPTQNSDYQANHCNTLLIGCLNFLGRLYLKRNIAKLGVYIRKVVEQIRD